jgi:hypothetical protein
VAWYFIDFALSGLGSGFIIFHRALPYAVDFAPLGHPSLRILLFTDAKLHKKNRITRNVNDI